MKVSFAFGAMVVGFALLALSGFWSTLFPATSAWTDAKAERRAEVQDRIHNLRFLVLAQANPNQRSFHSHAPIEEQNSRARRDPAALQAELGELMNESEQLNAEFQSAYDRPNTISSILKWTGLSLAAIGIIGWYAARNAS
jgi:hypothetical protein